MLVGPSAAALHVEQGAIPGEPDSGGGFRDPVGPRVAGHLEHGGAVGRSGAGAGRQWAASSAAVEVGLLESALDADHHPAVLPVVADVAAHIITADVRLS